MNNPIFRVLTLVSCLLAAMVLLVACRSTLGAVSGPAQLTGNVTYSQGPALPADAVVTVQLIDTTMQPKITEAHGGAAGPAAVISQQIVAVNGNQPPISFNITYQNDALNQSHTYGLYAAIADGASAPLFASDAYVPVLTMGNPDRAVTVNVVPVTDTTPASAAAVTTDAGLSGVAWEVVSLNGQAPAAGTTITAQFGADGTLSGTGGCNNYNAQYTVDGSSIKISPPASTMMACPDPAGQQETAYLTALSAATTFAVDGDQLTLSDANGAALVVYRVASQELAGTNWTALLINNGKDAVVSVNLNTQITAAFSTDGQISGSGGCNDYSGTYTVNNNEIKFGPIVATEMACSDAAVSQQEAEYFAALASAVSYQIQGQQLEMQNAKGDIAVTFEAAAP